MIQKIKHFIKENLHRVKIQKEKISLIFLEKFNCNPENLISIKEINLDNIFKNPDIQNSWSVCKERIDALQIPDYTGGVNLGDRKAIFFLIIFFKPKHVLEIGTHIGASTTSIACALSYNYYQEKIEPVFHTVDIRDVNSEIEKPWLKYGTKNSPYELIKKLHCEKFVKFITDSSINYLKNTEEKYDFIFLDGDHSAKTVYQELPLAINRLNKNGVVLLHDYFPDGKLLWEDGKIIYGPYVATTKLIKSGIKIVVVPLGRLPWETKLNSNITSLALVFKN